jgi:hypothetical protein
VTPLTLVSLVAAGTAAAQEEPLITPIAYGDAVSGELTQDSPMLQDGSYFVVYGFEGEVGDEITVWLNSQDFNANALLTDAADSLVAADDNAGGACNAHVSTALPATGRYHIYANSAEPGELGEFHLTLHEGVYPPEGQTACTGWVGLAGMIAVGDSATSLLGPDDRVLPNDSTAFYEVWQLSNPEGTPFTVDLSAPFDGAMILVRGLREVVTLDDDGGGGCNPRIAHVPEDRRAMRVVVTSREAFRGGEYQIHLRGVLLPAVNQPPCRPGTGG